ncbi:MAG: dTDP-4-dehydrorhamnose 3,5-epimerase [Bacteroidia bacterium]|nr:dTDP-4-dehydrorhamnose 3,5-epimerase [Bacteroidia bacterium]
MKIIETPLKDLLIIDPQVFKDERGYFYESYNQEKFFKAGIRDVFVQDNQSLSQKNVVRGLHFQHPPYAQAKLVRVIKGSVYDVVVDLRKDSPTYGQSFGIELTEENFLMLYVPVGFAHGFATLQDNTIFAYKCSAFYNKASEDTILWNDPTLNIDWKVQNPILSEKDKQGKLFQHFQSPF